jgi:hypothetical protein
MDFYEGVVRDYLRTDRSLFVNEGCCIQLHEEKLEKHAHWYCDAVVADFRSQTVFLCEVSYSLHLSDLIKRLKAWNDNWIGVRGGLARESSLPTLASDPKAWNVRPWLFVPLQHLDLLKRNLAQIGNFTPRITPLEMVQPWSYCADRQGGEVPCCPRHNRTKPLSIPPEMAV